MTEEEEVARIRAIYPDARALAQGTQTFVHLPAITIVTSAGAVEREALLCPSGHSGYTTRLFLDRKIETGLANWTEHNLFTRKWVTWSWNNILADQPWGSILANHLAAFR